MMRFRFCPACLVLLFVVVVLAACGDARKLQSVRLTPATADAQTFPNGQVPFAAAGTFSKPPSPVALTSKDVVWCVGSNGTCAGNIVAGATVDGNGVAQCIPSFTGTVTILAGKPSSSMVIPDGGRALKVFGSAQLTCP